jgi:hypothetical protein
MIRFHLNHGPLMPTEFCNLCLVNNGYVLRRCHGLPALPPSAALQPLTCMAAACYPLMHSLLPLLHVVS